MYSLIFDFNLNGDGKEVERYLTKIVDEWPKYYSSVQGVSGTYFLLNALGLGGDYSFRQVVDLDDPGVIRGIDEGMQNDANWAAARQEWLSHRKDARSTLVRHDAGDRRLMEQCQIKRGDRTLIFKTALSGGLETYRGLGSKMIASMRGLNGVRSARAFTPLVNPAGGSAVDVWAVVEDYGALENVAEAAGLMGDAGAGVRVLKTQVFGVMRAEAGVLIHSV